MAKTHAAITASFRCALMISSPCLRTLPILRLYYTKRDTAMSTVFKSHILYDIMSYIYEAYHPPARYSVCRHPCTRRRFLRRRFSRRRRRWLPVRAVRDDQGRGCRREPRHDRTFDDLCRLRHICDYLGKRLCIRLRSRPNHYGRESILQANCRARCKSVGLGQQPSCLRCAPRLRPPDRRQPQVHLLLRRR